MSQSKKKKKALTLKNLIILLNGRQKVLYGFESNISKKKTRNKTKY